MIATRAATPSDIPHLVRCIRELADYEKLLHVCNVTESGLMDALFGQRPVCEALVGEVDGKPEGFALYFTIFSTFVCKPGLYLEDLYVSTSARGLGLGKALLTRLAATAVERGYARLDWSVLDWNDPAIGFYKSLGARPLSDWTVFRLDGEALLSLGRA